MRRSPHILSHLGMLELKLEAFLVLQEGMVQRLSGSGELMFIILLINCEIASRANQERVRISFEIS